MNENPLISIIIPVYNAQNYLSFCFDSICHQTYTNFEVWMVDDGSNDQSSQICLDYTRSDVRFKYLTQKNAGASVARNNGLDHARGEWVCFVDADDWVEADYIGSLVDGLKSAADLIVSGIRYKHNSTTNELARKLFYSHKFSQVELYKAFTMNQLNRFGGPISKLYNFDIINRYAIRFNSQLRYAEDCNFMLQYISHIQSIQFVDAVSYNYRVGLSGSLSSKVYDAETEWYCYTQLKESYRTLVASLNIPSEIEAQAMQAPLMEYLFRYLSAVYNNGQNTSYIRSAIRTICKEAEPFIKYYEPYCKHDAIEAYLIKKKKGTLLDWYLRIFKLLRG
jgi:glycosyltransferase involved in cell wall biosynthesis